MKWLHMQATRLRFDLTIYILIDAEYVLIGPEADL